MRSFLLCLLNLLKGRLHRWKVGALGVCLLLLACGACAQDHEQKKEPQQQWAVLLDPSADPLVQSGLNAALGRLSHFYPSNGGTEDRLVKVEIAHAEIEQEGDEDLVLHMLMRGDPKDLGKKELQASVLLQARPENADDLGQKGIERAIFRAATIIQAKIFLYKAPHRVLRGLLRSEDTPLIMLSLEWMNEQIDKDGLGPYLRYLPEVLNVLPNTNKDARVLAIEAIGRLGQRQHVPILLRNTRFSNVLEANTAYEALARLGGHDARRFLEFAFMNEDENDAKKAAAKALKLIKQQEGHRMKTTSNATPNAFGGHR